MTDPTSPANPDDQRYGPDDRFRVRVELDPTAGDNESPREHTNLGTMVCHQHRHYRLPAEGDLVDEIRFRITPWKKNTQFGANDDERVANLAEWLKAEHGATVVLPVWSYDHGEFHLVAGERTYPFDDRWDSALAGVIYDTPAGREESGVAADLVAGALAQEVEQYDKWARNEMYYYVIERRDADGWNEVDSCSGYYSEEEAREQGIHAVPDTLDDDDKAAANTAAGEVRTATRRATELTLDDNPDADHATLTADVIRSLALAYLPDGHPIRQACDEADDSPNPKE